jgi:hypothetical protein
VLRISKFGGLITNASKYALPPGAASEQVNLTLYTPGQLTSRGGAKPVAYDDTGVVGVVEQVFPFSGGLGKPDRALVIDSSGNIAIIDGVTP